ncbi:MAG: hypothetical protein ABIT58_11470 [Ferruginibacter sp.]
MSHGISNTKRKAVLRIFFCLLLFEVTLFVFSGVSFSFLQGDRFFQLGADPFSWLVYGLNLPQFILKHYWIGFTLDISIIVLFLLFIRNPFSHGLALVLFILLFVFYICLMGYLTHRNYQAGFFMVLIPFIFKKDINKAFAFEAVRYFLLFFYLSAALLKFTNGSLLDPAHLSHMISGQFSAYFLEGNTGFRTHLNSYLMNHEKTGYLLYSGSFLVELSVIFGFFTKRYDKLIAVLLLVFHLTNWLIMDIAPFGQITFISLLFISHSFKVRQDQVVDRQLKNGLTIL